MKRGEAPRPGRDGSVCPFPVRGARPTRRRSAIAAGIVLMALLASLTAATLGPAFREGMSYPLFVMLLLVGG